MKSTSGRSSNELQRLKLKLEYQDDSPNNDR